MKEKLEKTFYVIVPVVIAALAIINFYFAFAHNKTINFAAGCFDVVMLAIMLVISCLINARINSKLQTWKGLLIKANNLVEVSKKINEDQEKENELLKKRITELEDDKWY